MFLVCHRDWTDRIWLSISVYMSCVQVIIPVTQWAGSANSCVNPFIYCFFSNKFRAGFKQLFAAGCCCCRRYCAAEDGWTRHWDAGGSGGEQTAAQCRRDEAAAAASVAAGQFHVRRCAVRRPTVDQFTTCATGALPITPAADLTFEATSF